MEPEPYLNSKRPIVLPRDSRITRLLVLSRELFPSNPWNGHQ